MKEFKNGWLRLPTKLLSFEELEHTDIIIAAILYDMAYVSETGFQFVITSHEKLAKQINRSTSTVKRSLQRLYRLRIIENIEKTNTGNKYWLNSLILPPKANKIAEAEEKAKKKESKEKLKNITQLKINGG